MPKSPKDMSMYMPDYRASMRIGNFVKAKHTVLSSIISKPESLYVSYSLPNFIGLLQKATTLSGSSGLRVYFASYKRMPASPENHFNNSLIPSGLEDNLTLIFAPTKNTGTDQVPVHSDTGDFYILNPTDGSIINLKGAPDPGIAARWVDSYYYSKCLVLEEILNIGVVDPRKKIYETQNMFYDIGSINELVSYLTNAGGEWEDVPAAVYVFFGAYHLNEKYGTTDFAGKLTLVFGFMDKYKGFIYYKNENKFDQDKPVPATAELRVISVPITPTILNAGDTGVPCPPPTCAASLGHNPPV